MSDEIWKTLIESVTAVLALAMMFGFLAYLLHKDSQMWK